MTSGRAIVGDGTNEAIWQAWAGLHAIATCRLDAVIPEVARVVVVAPHPDDEVLAFGGMLAMLAQRATSVALVSVTDGDASHPGSECWPPARLAERRHNESLEGLRILGVRLSGHVRLRIPDGRVGEHYGLLAQALNSLIKPGDRVLSTWKRDGHPDHEVVAHVVAHICRSAGCQHLQTPVWMWHWAEPADPRVPWSRMRRIALSEDVVQRKSHAIEAHTSQLTARAGGAPPVLTAATVQRLVRPFEYLILPGVP